MANKTVYCERAAGGVYYMKAPMDDRIPYDLKKAAQLNPNMNFVILNDDDTFGLPNVITKADLLEHLNVDQDLKIECGCGRKMRYNTEYCKACKTANDHKDILVKLLGNDYQKALIQDQVDTYFADHFVKKSGFDSYVAKPEKAKEDLFVKAITTSKKGVKTLR